MVVAGDLADPDSATGSGSGPRRSPGGSTCWSTTPGLGHYADFAEQDPEAIRRIIEVNLMALDGPDPEGRRGTCEARGSGQIVQVSSVLGFVGLPYSAAYVASKHAVNGLVKSLRYELRGTGVRVWAACPGRTESEFADRGDRPGRAGLPRPKGEPTDEGRPGIVRGLDRPTAPSSCPTPTAWAVVALAHWLPGPFDWAMGRWSARHLRPGDPTGRARRVEPAPSAP